MAHPVPSPVQFERTHAEHTFTYTFTHNSFAYLQSEGTHRDRPQDFEVLLSEGVAHPDSTGEQADHPQQGTNEGEELQGRGVEQQVGPGRGAHQSWTTTTNLGKSG